MGHHPFEKQIPTTLDVMHIYGTCSTLSYAHTHTHSTSNITHTLCQVLAKLVCGVVSLLWGKHKTKKKKNFNPNWKLSACAESNKQFTTAPGCPSQDGIPTTKYSQKTFCKKRLKIGPKIGTNEQIQNSKKKSAVMAFWKKALGCGITVSRHQL